MLVKEVEKRTHIHWQKESTWPAKLSDVQPIIAVGSRSQLEAFAVRTPASCQSTGATDAEGFRLCVRRGSSSAPPALFVLGMTRAVFCSGWAGFCESFTWGAEVSM